MAEHERSGLHGVNDPEQIRQQIEDYLRNHPDQREESPRGVERGEQQADLDLVIRGRQILTTAGVVAREVGIRDGRIVAIEPLGSGLTAASTVELADDEALIPGLVDTHVHVNEPGRTEWEGFASATKAAAAGGVTTIIDMPLNSIPSTVNVPALQLKRLCARPQAFVDVGFWGGAVPGNLGDLRSLHDEGVFGFKCFLLFSGVDEFPQLDPEEVEDYLAELAAYDAVLIVHAENSRAIDRAPKAEGDEYLRFLAPDPAARRTWPSRS